MDSPRVSVVMPVYNGERYLAAAVDSILAQQFSDFEFVVIDDGSSDRTPRILADYRDPRLRVLRIEHAGLIAALNAAIDHARAPYIARMDADDISYPHRLALQVECLDAQADVDLVTCVSQLLDEHGRGTGLTSGGVGDDMVLELAAGNSIVHGSVMVRRSALPADPVYRQAPEDYRLWVQMVRAGCRFHCLPETLYGFREHGTRYSLTHAASQSAGLVQVQWPLLEECMGRVDMSMPGVRARLLRGWGGVAGAAYRASDRSRGDAAHRQFRALLGGSADAASDAAIRYGIEAMIWGGCPWRAAWALRWWEWRRRPGTWSSYRNLLLAIPPLRRLATALRRTP